MHTVNSMLWDFFLSLLFWVCLCLGYVFVVGEIVLYMLWFRRILKRFLPQAARRWMLGEGNSVLIPDPRFSHRGIRLGWKVREREGEREISRKRIPMIAMGLIFRNETFPLFIKKLNIPSFWPEIEREREKIDREREREEKGREEKKMKVNLG